MCLPVNKLIHEYTCLVQPISIIFMVQSFLIFISPFARIVCYTDSKFIFNSI